MSSLGFHFLPSLPHHPTYNTLKAGSHLCGVMRHIALRTHQKFRSESWIVENSCQIIVSVIWEHPNLGDRVQIRCGRRILFYADNSFPLHRNDSNAFASCHLKYIIKNVHNATCRVAPHRCEPAFTLQNNYTYSHPNLTFFSTQIQIAYISPHIIWSAQEVHVLKIDHANAIYLPSAEPKAWDNDVVWH